MTRILVWALLAAVSLATGCRCGKDAANDEAAYPPCDFDIQVLECPTWGCGSNSPVLGAQGFDLDKEPASEWKIVAHAGDAPTIQRGERDSPTDISALTVEGGALRANGQPIETTDWWFLVRRKKKNNKMLECVIRVEEIGEVKPWYGKGPITTYALQVEGAGKAKRPLCRDKRGWGDKLRRKNGEAGGGPPTQATEASLLVAGERYKERAEVEPEEGNEFKKWFNVACAGSALAKMRLMGLNPEEDVENAELADRRTVLKMLTATYRNAGECKKKEWTMRGVPLALSRCSAEGECDIDLAPDGAPARVSEAYWNQEGARCFDHTRLFSGVSGKDADLPRQCRSQPGNPAECEALIRSDCGSLQRCQESDRTAWKTQAIEHPDHSNSP